jgi:hypothetical protein
MDFERIKYLIKYYFKFEQRAQKNFDEKLEFYQTLDENKLAYQFQKFETKQKLHRGILKSLKKITFIIAGASIVSGIAKVIFTYSSITPKIKTLKPQETELAITTVLISFFIIAVIVWISLIFYDRYIIKLEQEMKNINEIIKKKEERSER